MDSVWPCSLLYIIYILDTCMYDVVIYDVVMYDAVMYDAYYNIIVIMPLNKSICFVLCKFKI